jgi:hypothetical protein
LVREGNGLAQVLKKRDARLSPLGLFIVAHRAGRPKLAERMRLGVVEQHRSCPLYRLASVSLLPAELYPDVDSMPEDAPEATSAETSRRVASLN